jgi:Fe-S cluster assembly protein SufD
MPAVTPPATRVGAYERFLDRPLPTTDEEIWRYSRIADLDLSTYRPGAHAPEVAGPADVVRVGGDVVDLDPDEVPDLFAEINRELADVVHVVVPAGTVVAEPITITHSIPADGAVVCPRLVIEAGDDSEVTVVERFVSESGGPALVLPVLQIDARQASRVNYLGVNELSTDAWSIGHQRAVGGRDSATLLATVALGGHYARVRTEARLSGAGGSTRQIALYFAGGDQMHDFRTIQDHDAPHTTSDLLFKGAVQDSSRSVYTGLIKIRKHARGTAAFQTNRNLTLTEGAWAESVPNLEIETNDVRCSHASTVGPIDPEQRFYLESRGIPTRIAERLIVLGFFDEVLDQLPVGDLATELRRRVSAKLDLQPTLTGVA